MAGMAGMAGTAGMAGPALLGIDLGTSGVKVVVLGPDGAVRAGAVRDYPMRSPRPGWAESDPAVWWAATAAAVAEALARSGPDEVGAVGVDGQMHGVVLADASGAPVRPALLWPDSRAVGQLAAWRGLAAGVREALANPLMPGMAGPLLLWVRRNEPAAYARAVVALQPKDWLRHRLTGAFATDPSDASATLLWDVPADRWSAQVLAAAGIDAALLPEVRPSSAAAGTVTAEAAAATGLPAGVPVAVGAGDTPAALLATGLDGPGGLQISVGSGAQIVRPVREPVAAAEPRTHLYRSAGGASRWYAMAALHNAGLALGWVGKILGLGWTELYAAAEEGPAGGVVFVPYLTGERSPVLNPDARGAWLGLDLAADRAALARAAVEGVAFAIRHALESLPPSGAPDAEARLTGRGALPMRRLLADVLRMPVRYVHQSSASAVGAAMLGADAAGLPAPAVERKQGPVWEPGDRSAEYAEPYRRYRAHAERLAGAASGFGRGA